MKRGSQYKSAIWFDTDNQLDTIDLTIDPLVAKYDRDLTTEVLPLGKFFNAEDYHQKYILQRHSNLMKSFNSIYPAFKDFIDSTCAARLNGFAAGQGMKSLFEEEKDSYGLDSSEIEKLLR